jgi:Ca-activated chloride channel family protein
MMESRAQMATGMPPPPMQPAVVNRERYKDFKTNPTLSVAEDPVSTFSIDVDTVSYANARRFLGEGRLPPQDAIRTEELINYFDYGYAPPKDRSRPFSTFVSVAPAPWAQGRELVQIGLKGYDIPRGERPAANLVFLVDVSGSMSPENKLPLAKRALNILVDELGPKDRVSMVVYAGAAGVVLEPTGGDQKARIREAIDNLGAGGSTAGGEGLRRAYQLAESNFDPKAVNRVILMTDFDFNVGTVDDDSLESFVAKKRKSGVYLSVYGFGRDNYNDQLMQTLAQNGNGVAAYIDTLNEARKVFSDEMQGALFPIANDVKIQVEFNPALVSEYRLIGYETRALDRADFNNDAKDAGEIGAGHSVTAIYEITRTGSGAGSIDPLRYGQRPAANPNASEYGFLRIRYKPPGEDVSRLIERPITMADRKASFAAAPEQQRWATAVAAYGALLRNDATLPASFSWGDVEQIAQSARGEDRFGYRAEFMSLLRQARSAQPLTGPNGSLRPEGR